MMHQMLVRPDDIYKTGVIQPFNVVSQSPVAFARKEIDPFIQAIRPEGTTYVPSGTYDGLGIVSPEVIRTLGCSAGGCGRSFGTAEEDAAKAAAKFKNQRWYYGVGGLVLGVAAGFFIGKML